jgi:hypothetical protein
MLAAFALAYFWLRRRVDRADAFKETACMAMVAVAVFSPWLLKNLFFYGNPFYPFLNHLVGWTSPADWKGFLSDARSQDLARTFSSAAGWKEFLMRPWAISMRDRYLDDFAGISFLVFIPWALCQRWGIIKERPDVPATSTAIGLLSIAGYFLWALSSGMVRFMVPTFPFIASLAALAITRESVPTWLRRSGWAIAIWVSMINLLGTFSMGADFGSGLWSQLVRNADRSAYLGTWHMHYPSPYYPAMAYINQNLPPDAKVLFLGEPRTFYCERDSVAATVFDRNPFWEAAQEARSSEELFQRVRRSGITHIFVSANALYSNADRPNVMPKDIVAGQVLGDFWNRSLEKIFEDRQKSQDGATHNWLIVYKLLDKPRENLAVPLENPLRIVLDSLPGQSRA